MLVHTIRPRHPRRGRKRVGRGDGSGMGTYAGKGMKGQKARSGGGVRLGFEGGQNPQVKGLPMLRGFKNPFRLQYQVVNLGRLNDLPPDVTEVTPELLQLRRIVRHAAHPIKLLGHGDMERSLRVTVDRASASAKAKIQSAGGSVTERSSRSKLSPISQAEDSLVPTSESTASASGAAGDVAAPDQPEGEQGA